MAKGKMPPWLQKKGAPAKGKGAKAHPKGCMCKECKGK